MAASEPDRHLEILGADTEPRPGPSRAAWVVPALAVAAAGALWMAAGGGSAPTAPILPEPPVVEEPTPAPTPARWGGDELLVAVDGSDLVAIDPVDGRSRTFPLPSPPRAIAAGSDATVFVLNHDESVDLVDLDSGRSEPFASGVEWFAPSATPGNVWLRVDSAPTRIVETDATGRELSVVDRVDEPDGDPRLLHDELGRLSLLTGEHQVALGSYDPLAATETTLFARRCEADRCHIERRPLSPTADWAPITARPRHVERVVASDDGRWLLSVGPIVVLYEADRWGPKLVHTGATSAVFGRDSEALYVFTGGSDVTVVDLVADANRSLHLAADHKGALDWVAVAR